MRSCTLSTQQCAGTQVPDKWQFLSFIANLYQNAGNKKKKRTQGTEFYWGKRVEVEQKRHPTPVFLPGESHGQKSLTVSNPWGCKSQTPLSN